MKTRRVYQVLIVGCLTCWVLPDSALGMRQLAAKQHRFMQRDPLAQQVGITSADQATHGVLFEPLITGACCGRDLTRTAILAGSGYEDGINIYNYMRLAPLGATDPSGMGRCTCTYGPAARAKRNNWCGGAHTLNTCDVSTCDVCVRGRWYTIPCRWDP